MTTSRTRWIQIGAFGVLAWVLIQGGFSDGDAQRAAVGERSASGAATSPLASAVSSSIGPGAHATAGVPAGLAVGSNLAPQEAGLGLIAPIEVIVSRNDTLDRIFRRLKLDLADLASLRNLPGLQSKVDRLRPGEALKLWHQDGSLFAFERKLSPSETLKVTRGEAGFSADVLENPLETETRTVEGTIDSSLFEAVQAAGAHDQTALALADIFAWDVDFVLDIRPGDSFVITYDRISQDGTYVKDGPILAARFVNQGRAHVALRYTSPDGASRYYTPDGRSLRKAFLRAPLDFTRVSSSFNLSRRHPILNRIRAHKGVDYAAPSGTPVRAAGDGRIRFAGHKGGYGNVLEIDHANGVSTLYGHLSRFRKGMKAGRRVEQGMVVAYVGMSGLATGPHLHYEYRLNGTWKNPQTVKLPDATPIDPKWRDDFLAATRPLLASLDAAPAGGRVVAR